MRLQRALNAADDVVRAGVDACVLKRVGEILIFETVSRGTNVTNDSVGILQ